MEAHSLGGNMADMKIFFGRDSKSAQPFTDRYLISGTPEYKELERVVSSEEINWIKATSLLNSAYVCVHNEKSGRAKYMYKILVGVSRVFNPAPYQNPVKIWENIESKPQLHSGGKLYPDLRSAFFAATRWQVQVDACGECGEFFVKSHFEGGYGHSIPFSHHFCSPSCAEGFSERVLQRELETAQKL